MYSSNIFPHFKRFFITFVMMYKYLYHCVLEYTVVYALN
nr:MAG TPA: hypothetical protein [Caudoviricetes sp.]